MRGKGLKWHIFKTKLRPNIPAIIPGGILNIYMLKVTSLAIISPSSP